ncbi:MAG: tetratricopeptide repeat protein [Bryobacteraceae bacterium]
MQLSQAGDLGRAEQCYTEALKRRADPETLTRAIALYRKAMSSNGAEPERVYNLALALFRHGDYKASLQTLSSHPQTNAEWPALAAANRRALGDFQAASDELRAAVMRAPLNEAYRNDFILSLLRSGGEREAGEQLDAAILQFPRSAKLHSVLGMRAYANGRTDEAVRYYERAVTLEPNAADLHAALGDIHSATGSYSKAAVAFAAATRLDPSDPDYHVKEGNNLIRLQNIAAASRSFRKALAFDPRSLQANLQLGKIAAADAKFGVALAHLKLAANTEEAPAEVYYQLSQIYRRLGRQAEAASALKMYQERKAKNEATP